MQGQIKAFSATGNQRKEEGYWEETGEDKI